MANVCRVESAGGTQNAAGVETSALKLFVSMASPALEDSVADLQRLRQALLKAHNIELTGVDLKILGLLPALLRKYDWKVTCALIREDEIFHEKSGGAGKRGCGYRLIGLEAGGTADGVRADSICGDGR